MSGRNEIDIERALVLKAEHQPGQLPVAHDPAFHPPADLVILAEEALQVAAGKKDRPGTAGSGPGSAQNGLLAVVKKGRGHGRLGGASADAGFSATAIDAAIAGTESATLFGRFEGLQRPFDPPDFPLRVQAKTLQSGSRRF